MTRIIPISDFNSQLSYLKLDYIRDNYESLAKKAAQKNWTHVQYLSELIQAQTHERRDRAIERRIAQARIPQIKTLEQFKWSWPKKINQQQIQNLFRLKFVEDKSNVVLLGGVGLGKTHIASAIGYEACLKGYSVLFSTAVNTINTLTAAQSTGRLKQELDKCLKPDLLIMDELGYLPIDKTGADLLFQVISHRYEQGSLIITTNRAFKEWPEIFNNDSTLTSALLDRLLHHTETVVIEGRSFRMKDIIES
ncbi:MAG: ATP-binding protein [Deltaproteobacteria bacterium]|nr:MAG: ATP-binding protein [Deltaproteobacteria bacterium]